jgi:hypothetical protein
MSGRISAESRVRRRIFAESIGFLSNCQSAGYHIHQKRASCFVPRCNGRCHELQLFSRDLTSHVGSPWLRPPRLSGIFHRLCRAPAANALQAVAFFNGFASHFLPLPHPHPLTLRSAKSFLLCLQMKLTDPSYYRHFSINTRVH